MNKKMCWGVQRVEMNCSDEKNETVKKRCFCEQHELYRIEIGEINCEYCMSCHHTKTSMRKVVHWSMLFIRNAVWLSKSESKHRSG